VVSHPIQHNSILSDAMPDRDYLIAVMRMETDKRESLMCSEAERRRTFKSSWPLGGVSWEACARAGLYYIGKSQKA